MLQHHFLIALRNLQRHKASFFIHLAGLSTGLACVLLIYLWVQDEMSFDKFHRNDRQLYQVMESSTENGRIIIHESTQGPLAAAMSNDLPEVQMAVPVFSLRKEGLYLQLRNKATTVRSTGLFAGSGFFSAFSFPLLQGNSRQVLSDKNGVVISEDLARSLFGTSQLVVGKRVEWELMGMKRTALVTGVFAKLPANSSLQFDFVFSYDMLLADLVPNFQKWWNEGPATYLLLRPGTNLPAFNAKLAHFIRPYFKETIFTLFARPFSSAYLYGHYENGVQAGGRIEYVRLFSLVALFILVIACINFMNLSTARASRRLKEVGVKKVVGSSRRTLIVQFLSEAVLISFLSLLVACLLVSAFLPFVRMLTGKEFNIRLTPEIISFLLGIVLLTGLLAGSYPAFYLSHFSPISILKGKVKTSLAALLARKGLVVFQFVISLVLIVAVLVIQRQVDYVQSTHLGYDKDNVIVFDKEGASAKDTEAFLDELRKQPGIVNASAIQQGIVQGSTTGASTYGVEWPGKTSKDLVDFTVRAVDYNLLETLGIRLKEGRSFSPAFGAEQTKLIFNEAAVKVMGLKEPIGARVKMWGEEKSIVGVVRDFHVASLYEAIAPMVFFYGPQNTSTIMARIQRGREKETLRQLENFYKKYNPGFVFTYHFIDDEYQAQYVAEQRVAVLSKYFAGLAILISCLGLFGLAAFHAEVRTKEIGIRKVLGASVKNIVLLLSKDFLVLVLLAILIAFPLAWWAMNQWLQGFAYHIKISPWLFALAALVLLLITVFTLGYQSLKTAFANPVRSLRAE